MPFKKKTNQSTNKYNSVKYDIQTGQPIQGTIENWRKDNPNGIYADSKLEYQFFQILKESGIPFVFKPKGVELFPKFFTTKYDFSHEDQKEMKRIKKETKISTVKVRKGYERSIRNDFPVASRRWNIDFYLPDYNFYIECKGKENDVFPIKRDIVRWNWVSSSERVAVLYTLTELKGFLEKIQKDGYMPGKFLHEQGKAWEDECLEFLSQQGEGTVRRATDAEEAQAIDLVHTTSQGVSYIQCKSSFGTIPYGDILDRMPSDGRKLIMHQSMKYDSKGKPEVRGKYLIMPFK